jgi:hypothetical protein
VTRKLPVSLCVFSCAASTSLIIAAHNVSNFHDLESIFVCDLKSIASIESKYFISEACSVMMEGRRWISAAGNRKDR